ncbi:MAG: LemA family protein [Oscillospiraceae bacterium]
MKQKIKNFLIWGSIAAALVILIAGIFIVKNNHAISLEEQVHESQSSIQVQEKRRFDLINNLVDTVDEYAKHENETLKEVVDLRKQIQNGDVNNTQLAINAVGEAYPNLKANENYIQLMTELSMTENMIAEHRNNFNIQIKNYNKFLRAFPNNFILNMLGYEKINVQYSDYDAPSDATQSLFEDK